MVTPHSCVRRHQTGTGGRCRQERKLRTILKNTEIGKTQTGMALALKCLGKAMLTRILTNRSLGVSGLRLRVAIPGVADET